MNQNKIDKILAGISLLTMAFGSSVIAENLLHIKILSLVFPGAVKLSSGLCFVLSGASFLLLLTGTTTPLRKNIFGALSLSVVIFGFVALVRELNSLDLILRFICVDDFGTTDGRMPAISAVCFILLGLAFLALDSDSFKRTGQCLLHLITLGSFIVIVGYLYNLPSLYTISSSIAMALQSAFIFFILSIAVTQLNPHIGIGAILRGNKIGNITARKIFPFVLLFGALRIVGIHLDFISANFASALYTTCFVFGGLLIIWLTSSKLNRIDEKRTAAENKIIDINQGLEQMVEMRTLQLVNSNNALLDEISERRKTEATLREMSNRFSKIFHSSPSGKAITMCELNKSNGTGNDLLIHKVIEINKEFLEILGYERDEAIRDHAIDLELIIDTAQSKEITHLLKTQGYFKNKEAPLTRKDGTIQNCILSVEPIDIEGRTHFLWVCYDNSERKKMENQLHQAKEAAEQLAKVKEQFLANMSHEIRTPMNSIIGFANMLNQTNINATQREYISTISSASKSLLHLINEILDYSKLEAGKATVEKTKFTLKETLQIIYRMFMDKAREKGIRLSVTCDKKLPEQIVGDETKLNQILMNLVGNSFKFTERGLVHIDCCVVEEKNNQLKIKFSVKDTGIGIAAEHLEGIFDRFNQANSNTTRQYGGTGLGLSIVKQLVEIQGGQIAVESTPERGSEFHFTLDYEKNVSPIPPALPAKTIQKQQVKTRSRILLAEDNLMNQKLAVALLKKAGCEIDIAENGMQALEMLKNNSYDIVLMDIQMPVLDGYHTAQMIREKMKLSIPIIAVTAHAFKGEREKCVSYGMNDYITKPYDEEDLLIMLIKYLPEKQQLFSSDGENGMNGENAGWCKGYQPLEEGVTTTLEEIPSVTNLTYLNEISRGNKAFVEEMIKEFLSQNTEHLDRLECAVAKKQFDVISKTVHTMKTTTSFVGLHMVIGDNLHIMETLAGTQQNFEDLRKNFRIVQTQCLLAHEELKAAQVG